MSTYIEQSNGYLIDGARSIPMSKSNRHYVKALESTNTITKYSGSEAELDAAKSDKVNETSVEFQKRHSIDLKTANLNAIYYQPSTGDAAIKMVADMVIANEAIVYLESLSDLADINSYEVSWTS